MVEIFSIAYVFSFTALGVFLSYVFGRLYTIVNKNFVHVYERKHNLFTYGLFGAKRKNSSVDELRTLVIFILSLFISTAGSVIGTSLVSPQYLFQARYIWISVVLIQLLMYGHDLGLRIAESIGRVKVNRNSNRYILFKESGWLKTLLLNILIMLIMCIVAVVPTTLVFIWFTK